MKIKYFSKHIFWSYNKEADLPEDLIIKQVAVYGEIYDLKKLSELINKEKILTVLQTIKTEYEKRVNFIEKIIL